MPKDLFAPAKRKSAPANVIPAYAVIVSRFPPQSEFNFYSFLRSLRSLHEPTSGGSFQFSADSHPRFYNLSFLARVRKNEPPDVGCYFY
jgi:hypothetical protein